jgi:hypothetical protein
MEFLQSNAYSSFWWFGASGMSWERSEKLKAELTRQGRRDQLDQAKPPVGAPAAMSAYFYQFMRAFMRPRGVNAGALTIERPVLIGEWGGHWMENSTEVLDAELHTGLWATAATPMAGATGYWWWPHVHFRNRYPHYAALANFMAGEDRRGLDLAEAQLALAGEGAGRLAAMGVQTRELADVYVYAREAIRKLEGIEPVTGAKLKVTGLAPGPVRVELWDTFRGEIRERRTARAGPDGLEMDLGAVRVDVAIKIRPDRSGVAREEPAGTSGPPGR